MDIFTLDRGFIKQELIDEFVAAIWTDRYYGDGDFEISVPSTSPMNTLLPRGQILMCEGSDEPMILETRDIKDGVLKTTGITLAQWLNNRTIRTSADHAIREWLLTGYPPGEAMQQIVQHMCIGGPYLDGTIPIGIPVAHLAQFVIPGLQAATYDTTGPAVALSVPFGPVFDAVKEIATTYEVGQKIVLDGAYSDYYIISYITYRGADRTSDQAVNPVVRFSPEMDSFTNISDLESITDHRNYIYMFAPSAPPAIVSAAGFASSTSPVGGFDLKVLQGTVDSLPDGLTTPTLLDLLNQNALKELQNRKVVQLVDGEIVQNEGVTYGSNFFLGDVVEVEGNSGVLQKARITEYIRSQDNAGERAYPTLSMID